MCRSWLWTCMKNTRDFAKRIRETLNKNLLLKRLKLLPVEDLYLKTHLTSLYLQIKLFQQIHNNKPIHTTNLNRGNNLISMVKPRMQVISIKLVHPICSATTKIHSHSYLKETQWMRLVFLQWCRTLTWAKVNKCWTIVPLDLCHLQVSISQIDHKALMCRPITMVMVQLAWHSLMILHGLSQNHGCQQLLAHQANNKAAQIIQHKAKIRLFERTDLNL